MTINSGKATVKASLRLRVQAGVTVDPPDPIPGRADFSAVAYANIIELVGTFNNTETCDLEANLFADINVGAGINANFDFAGIDFTVPAPDVQTTLVTFGLIGPTCLIGDDSATPTSDITATASTSAGDYMTATGGYGGDTTTTEETTIITTDCAPTKPTSFATANITVEDTTLRKCLVPVSLGGNCPIDQFTEIRPGGATATAGPTAGTAIETPSSSTGMAEYAESESKWTSATAASAVASEEAVTSTEDVTAVTPGVVFGDEDLANGTVLQTPTKTLGAGFIL